MSVAGDGSAEERGAVRLPDGRELAMRSWRTAAPRAAVLVVHGIGEHSGRYRRTAGVLSRAGYEVHAMDLPGHGHSPGPRGHVGDFRELTGAVLASREEVRRARGDRLSLFLFGHSLGGLVALRTVQEGAAHAFRGLILSAPALRLRLAVPLWKRALARPASRLVPRLSMDNGIEPADLSRDPEEVAAYRTDPLVHRRISARMFEEMTHQMELAAAALRTRPLPDTLWLLPRADRVCDSDAACALATGTPTPERVTVRSYRGAYHEALNDPARERVLHDLTGWLEAHSG